MKDSYVEDLKHYNARRDANNAQHVHNKVGLCTRFDCVNLDKKCDECIRFSEYETDSSDSRS